MTETLQRPLRPSPIRPAPVRQPPRSRGRAGVTGAVWAAAAGLVLLVLPTLLAWATDPRAGAGAADALRTGAQLWLVAHGCSLEVGGATFGLTPLGLLAVPVLLLARAGATAARACGVASLRSAGALTLAVAGPYACLATVVAAASATSTVRPVPAQALLAALVIALAGAGVGVVRGAGLTDGIRSRVPAMLHTPLAAATAAVAVLLGAGALLVGLSLGLHLDRARELTGASSPGPVGGVALLLLGVALAPNAVVFGAAWLTGPGFAVGVGTTVSPLAHELGPVPALPLLAALPGAGVPAPWGFAALLVPVVAGVVAGAVLQRRRPRTGVLRTIAAAAIVGPVTGLLLAPLAWLSGGPAGGGRLAQIGPSAWQVAVAATVPVALAAVVAAVAVRQAADRAAARPDD